ncbi:hypothetical protein DTO169C6_4219 [Paecilomyces variotii]|nr:hypothetical protein DTO169C6_4219 [Paecilomyces variotii]
MGIMIPVYLLNSLYLAPITLWVYFNYGRPTKPERPSKSTSEHQHGHCNPGGNGQLNHHDHMENKELEHGHDQSHGQHHSEVHGEGHHHMGGSSRPMFATTTVAVCHCGAGCLLGDIVGEWLVYGTDAKINGHRLWVSFLVDYGFALLFGIVFQYFSIAPMSGDYGPVTIWRSIKADFLSLTSFQIGLYGWMAIYQIPIWNFRLEVSNVVYWWMMQIGMFAGHWTAVPMNWLLIKYKVKEPCA